MLALAHIENRLKSEESAYAARMFEYLDLELKALKKEIAAGTMTVRKLSGPDRGIFRFRGILRSRLLEILLRVRNFGIGQVGDELARQGAK